MQPPGTQDDCNLNAPRLISDKDAFGACPFNFIRAVLIQQQVAFKENPHGGHVGDNQTEGGGLFEF